MVAWLSQNWLGRYLICRKFCFEYIRKGDCACDNKGIRRQNPRAHIPDNTPILRSEILVKFQKFHNIQKTACE